METHGGPTHENTLSPEQQGILGLFERFTGEKGYTPLRTLTDATGIYLFEAATTPIAREDGKQAHIQAIYLTAGDHGLNASENTIIIREDYVDGEMSSWPTTVAELNAETKEWKKID